MTRSEKTLAQYNRACQDESLSRQAAAEAHLRSAAGNQTRMTQNAQRVYLLALAEYQDCREKWAIDRSRGIRRNLPILERLTDLRRWVQTWRARAEGAV